MEKIEKLQEFNWLEGRDALTIALDNTIIKKLNEVIDYLNFKENLIKTISNMEKKYIGEHLKGREWIKDLFDWIADGADTEYWLKRKYQTDNTLLVKDLEQLLDKARKEGKKEAFTKDEWFMLKLAMNDIFNNGNTAYEEISEKIESYLN